MMKLSKIGRKNFVIFSLVIMLGLIGYINYSLNKQSLLQTSSELEEYRMTMLEESGVLLDLLDDDIGEMEEIESIINDIDTKDDNPEISTQETQVVDSKDSHEVIDIIQEASTQITESITNKESMQSSIYFIESKLERDKKRSQMISQLNDIINNQLTSEEMRNQAQNIKMQTITSTEKEGLLENMIVAKGFSDAIVYLTDNSINIVVSSENLAEEDVAKIVDVVRRETDIEMSGITIMNKK